MRISIVNLTSDSSDNETERSVVNRTTANLFTREKNSHTFFCENEQAVVEHRVPLFKITFKDENTSRIYRRRLEEIAKNLVAAKFTEDSESNSSDLVLEIYEPTENFNTTVTSGFSGGQTPVINYCNTNSIFGFSQDNVLPTTWFDQTNHSTSFSDALTESTQPQEVQQSIVQPEYSSVNFNVKKRKSTEDSDLSSQRKKLKVEYQSECLSQFQNETDKLANTEQNSSENLHNDSVWYSNNTQSSVTETSGTHHHDPEWYNSSNAQSKPAEIVPIEKLKNLSQAQDISSLLTNKRKSVTFTYRVLKIGSSDYVKKRTFTISEDGIQLCASHLNENSTVVKLNIAMASIVKIGACFSKILPALFIHVCKNAAAIIREALGINKDYTAFFDPESADDNCNKIIILPDTLPECCGVLKSMVNLGLITKLDKESSDIILLNSFSKVLERENPQIKGFASNLFLNITCHTIRLGTYKCSQMRFNVNISMKGFQFQMPKVGGDEIFKKITIGFAEINKLYVSLQKISALFVHVNYLCAQRIRSLIEMSETDKSDVYFDPDSETIAEQRLVIVFNKIKPSQQEILINLLSHTNSAELTLQKIIHQMLYNHM